jgi:hypothetical protein
VGADMTDQGSQKATLANIKTLITLCKKHKIKRIRLDNFEAEFDSQAFLSKKSAKGIIDLITRKPTKEEIEEDLYYSAQ